MRCEGLHGQVFSLNELSEKSIIPPLHPNCKCKLFAMDSAALAVYNRNRDGFIHQIDLYCNSENLDDGGGVQYRLVDGYDKTWFVNGRPIETWR